jgi:hypothetical protein
VSGLSLWLVPDAAAGALLEAVIAELASRLGGPRFRAHLTLLPGLPGTEAEALVRGATLAAATPPVSLTLARVAHTPAYFRCLFLEAERTAELLGTHQRARRLFGGGPDEFRPHVSLAYGRLSTAVGEPGARALQEALRLPMTMRGERVEVWATRGDVSRWRALDGFALSG